LKSGDKKINTLLESPKFIHGVSPCLFNSRIGQTNLLITQATGIKPRKSIQRGSAKNKAPNMAMAQTSCSDEQLALPPCGGSKNRKALHRYNQLTY
jgi:hypothetical protein